MLKRWEVQLRPISPIAGDDEKAEDVEVWVRKKQRVG